MGDVNLTFFQQCAPAFYKTQIQTALKSDSLDSAASVLDAILLVVDSLLSLIQVNALDASELLHAVLKDFLSWSSEQMSRSDQLQVQSLFHCLLYATPKYKAKRRFGQKTIQVLSVLRRETAVNSDSKDFAKFFLQVVLPRIKEDGEAVERLADALELGEEAESALRLAVFKHAPRSPSVQAKRTKEEQATLSPVQRRSPRPDSTLIHLENQTKPLRHNLQRDQRKEVSVKMAPVKVQLTPEHAENSISDSAKALKEVNKQFFYEKKKLSAMKREDDGTFVTPKVLVTDTPKKEEVVRGRQVPAFRNIFS